jgi:hypothetical protein
MKQLTINEMRNNLTLAIEDEVWLGVFEKAVCEWAPLDRTNSTFLYMIYENLMIIYALQNIKSADERQVFYIENSIMLDYAAKWEEALPLLEQERKEG